MSIRDEKVALDTNVWIFGLRHPPEAPACALLLDRLGELNVVLPRQILRELQANLAEEEMKTLFRLVKRYAKRVAIRAEMADMQVIRKYQDRGCRLGDAVVTAHLEELGVDALVTENRHFLEEIRGLPFRTLTAREALAELQK